MSSRSGPAPFWICHECGAQMRPIMIDEIPHCASCHGEFVEVLDQEINPDPFHELPHPPTRPSQLPPRIPTENRPPGSPPAEPSGILGSIFGLFQGNPENHVHPPALPSNPRTVGTGDTSTTNRGDGTRTWTFNIGGGRGSVTFGTIGGMGPGMGMGGGNVDDELGNIFPGFPRGLGGQNPFPSIDTEIGPNTQQGPAMLRALMSALMDENMLPAHLQEPMFLGPQGMVNMGDYVATEQGFHDVLEQLMQAAGPQGPLPATDAVIEGLPRYKLDEKALETSQFKDCPVCKDDFAVGDEVMRIPCKHIFHPDCLQPWLKVNGSCPVCRFSLVPDEVNHPESSTAPNVTQQPQQNAGTAITNMLNRLWGQSGTTSPTSPPTSGPSRQPDNLPNPSNPPNISNPPSQANPTPDPATSNSVVKLICSFR
ncbi:hypothetical protein TREMEDRAFT_63337 [Tremella mesenterica DSM 1558]|uniref:uncharacterized protein n=1 Tax=Tremella mesenterica (strain ATCC 24925 / CBS 8224 / DSM 1558 / NBRC 9311 / NRRL Y-6157 / RJB 2259-6 / UBC 559-6) TaxID=578456 RepID=UPI0003F48E2D|nr:uncharacterized protein TREMEDRAFT_63337 [Tremella mesenterica DSM 1558]EIW68167.1 hypothetical protein TREMEDRAFT_63337 [Tremella mesenterica DSM 1558]